MKRAIVSIILLCFVGIVYAGSGIVPAGAVPGMFPVGGATFPNTSVLSDFTGTNGTVPTGFTDLVGTPQIQSNQFAGGSADDNTAIWDTSYTADNLEAYVTVATVPGDTGVVALFFGDGSLNGYGLICQKLTAGTDTCEVHLLVAGSTGAQVGSTQDQEFSNGDQIGFKRSGSTLQIWYKPAAGSATQLGGDITDATYNPDQIAISVTGTAARLDDFGGGTP